jgi:hypothetical protein
VVGVDVLERRGDPAAAIAGVIGGYFLGIAMATPALGYGAWRLSSHLKYKPVYRRETR